MSPDLHIRLGLFAVLHPGSVRALRELGFDLALEHDRPLEEACAMRDLDADWVLEELLIEEAGLERTREDADWSIMQPALPRAAQWSPDSYLAA